MPYPIISVIIPIYNIESCMRTCVDSVIKQSYRNLEILLVDDGSTDKSGKICDEYAAKDSRVKVIHKKNGGLSSARNVALDVMIGKYVVCVDGDDYIDNDLIKILYHEAKNRNADIVTSFYRKANEYDNGINAKVAKPVKYNGCLYNNEKALEKLMYQIGVTTSAWGKLYKSELFEGIRYPEGSICEDLPVTYKLFARARCVFITNLRSYHYRQRSTSIIHSDFSEERFEALDFVKEESKFIEEKYPKIKRAAYNREFMEAVYILTEIGDSEGYQVEKQSAEETYKKYRRVVVLDPRTKIITRLYGVLGVRTLNTIKNMVRNVLNWKG